MRKISIVLLLNGLFVYVLSGQNLIQQIKEAYNTLDSVSSIENIVISFRKEIETIRKEMDNTTLELYGFDYGSMDSIQKQETIDSIFRKTMYTKTLIEERVSMFISTLNNSGEPIYALNLTVGRSECSDKPFFLHPDTTCLPFNLFYLDERFNLKFYVLVENGRYVDSGNVWFTFSRPVARNFPRVLRSIMRKNPQYLLLSAELEGTNTLLYMLDDRIYVYRIAQRKKYELSEYLRKYPPQFIRSE